MNSFLKNYGLYTDLYELTMAQGYFFNNMKDIHACFDYFFRKNPFAGGYVIFAGLDDLLDFLKNFTFSSEDLNFLSKINFKTEFLKFLENYSFDGDIFSVKEGEIIFPNEPVIRVEGNIISCQLIETILLNIINFESLIATKASRIRYVAGDRIFADFGLRRAQGFGAINASKAAIIGGADSTSNVFSAKEYNLHTTGTQAHSWIESFDDELTAFRKYAELYPENCILLVDTYDTLNSGIPNAIKIAKELKNKGYELKAIRLDSGDLAYLSKKARKMLDNNGFKNVKIIVSNQLDEYVIRSLNEQNAPIDAFGVGTKLVTALPSAALDGVYKLSYFNNTPRMKISENVEKTTLPGKKDILRFIDKDNCFVADAVVLNNESKIDRIIHPLFNEKQFNLSGLKCEKLLCKVMEKGKKIIDNNVKKSSEYRKKRWEQLNPEYKRFENPHIYKVGISEKLLKLRNNLIKKYKKF